MDFPSVSHGHPLSQIAINPKLQGKEVALLKQRNQWQNIDIAYAASWRTYITAQLFSLQ